MANNILNIPLELLETIVSSVSNTDILNISTVCKTLNNFINKNKFIHLYRVYNTKYLSLGNLNNSWKSNLSNLYIGNIFNCSYENISFNFKTCIKKLELKNIYINELDITNFIEIEKLIINESIVKVLIGVDTSNTLLKLDCSLSTIFNIKISSHLRNLNINYTILKSLYIPLENSLVKFQSKNCNFISSEGNIVNQFNCLPLLYSKLVMFSIKTKYIWNEFDLVGIDSISNISIDNPSVKNLNFLQNCKHLKNLEISNSKIENMSIIKNIVCSIQKLSLRENRIHNFNFIKQ